MILVKSKFVFPLPFLLFLNDVFQDFEEHYLPVSHPELSWDDRCFSVYKILDARKHTFHEEHSGQLLFDG